MSLVSCKKLLDLSKQLVNHLILPNRGAKTKFAAYFPARPFKLRPDKLDVGMSGASYQTTIQRKRQVTDLNVPVFGETPVECLKWTNWKMLRDVRRRYVYSYHFPLSNNLTCLMRNNILPTTIKELALNEMGELPRARYSGWLVWRCGITSRPRGKYLKFKMSRIAFRNLADYNFVSGAMRSCWGP
ncbi:28S ribosomal protein S14, mitochondrial [Tetranychus urticae]|uniref:Small ribosomal subunit protein uS14 n=1 Tax=Tetranychus urticae TaxID=32264 RepID=T1KBB5_TETUR|nr:28S ribosomal protein S14, mitochondrial [Tetranychus urticae]